MPRARRENERLTDGRRARRAGLLKVGGSEGFVASAGMSRNPPPKKGEHQLLDMRGGGCLNEACRPRGG